MTQAQNGAEALKILDEAIEPSPPVQTQFVSNTKIQKISHTHEAIMMHMLTNPTHTLKEIAAVFGHTPTWISALIHNDLFQARFRELQKEHFHAQMEPISKRLETLTALAVERWGEMIEDSADPEYIKSSADKLLQRLGYGAANKVGVNVNVQTIGTTQATTREAIEAATRARLRLRAIQGEAVEGEYVEVKSS